MSDPRRLDHLRKLVGADIADSGKPAKTIASDERQRIQEDYRQERLRRLHEAGADYSGRETVERVFRRLGRR